MQKTEFSRIIGELIFVSTLKTFVEIDGPQSFDLIQQNALFALRLRVSGWLPGETFCELAKSPDFADDWLKSVKISLEGLSDAKLVEETKAGWTLTELGVAYREEARAKTEEYIPLDDETFSRTIH